MKKKKTKKDKFEKFNDYELYVLKRMSLDSSYKFHIEKDYGKKLNTIHEQLTNDIIKEIKKRKEKGDSIF